MPKKACPFSIIECDGKTLTVANSTVWVKVEGINHPVKWKVDSTEDEFREAIRKKVRDKSGGAGAPRLLFALCIPPRPFHSPLYTLLCVL